MITLNQVTKIFGSRRLLDGIDLTIETGQTLVLFGPSGTGKTVLMKIILGLVRPDGGTITVDEERIDQMRERELTKYRLKTGTLFQYYALFDSMTVLENVGFYLKNHSIMPVDQISKIVSEELSRVSMDGSENLKPAELSGGMQKRVGIARAIVHRPAILFYDSPTDGLDPVTSDRIIELIKEINSKFNVTSLVISNDMNTAFRLGNKLAMLLHGKIHYSGTPEEVAASSDPYVYQFIRGLETGPLTKENSEL
jgi:phospholipid/cholesterol/gamma-HCH transport system ATP-binding protein